MRVGVGWFSAFLARGQENEPCLLHLPKASLVSKPNAQCAVTRALGIAYLGTYYMYPTGYR